MQCCMTADGGTPGRGLQSGAVSAPLSWRGRGGVGVVLLVDLRGSIQCAEDGFFRPGFAEAKKDSLQISVYLAGFRGIASVSPCLRLSLAGGQEK